VDAFPGESGERGNLLWSNISTIDKKFYKIYNRAFDKRQEGDYDDFVSFEKEEVMEDLKRMKEFLIELEKFIEKRI
jgi:uncharacterized protein (UPF0332 family)